MIKKKKIFRKKIQPKKHSSLWLIMGLPGAAIAIFLLFFFLAPPPKLKPLALLKIPTSSTVVLPGPMENQENNPFVLGAETIDPRDIVTYVNEQRMKLGARPLRVNATLTKAAQMRADVIMKYQNFSHQDPYSHIQLDTVLPLLNYPFSWASENIGMGDTTARAFVNGFMNSPPHRTNLLNPELVETGVAVATGPYKQYYVTIAVQIFAIPTDLATYLGYTEQDVEDYKNLLQQIKDQLALTHTLRDKDPANEAYYDKWESLLIRQQEIVADLSHTMAQDKPFAREMIALIQEYNQNWKSVAIN